MQLGLAGPHLAPPEPGARPPQTESAFGSRLKLPNRDPPAVDWSVFSHAFPLGPILFNTSDNRPSEIRFAHDLDLRWYDFKAPNLASWPHLKAAFAASGAHAHIWGCSATTVYRRILSHLRNNPGKRFNYGDLLDDTGVPYNLTALEAKQWYMDALIKNYPAFALAHLQVPVHGAVPGFGSEWANYDDLPGISASLKKLVTGKILHINSMFSKSGKTWTKSETRKDLELTYLGSRTIDEFGYVIYS